MNERSPERARTHPVRIDAPRDQLAGVFAPPAGPDRRRPVLFCGPWGWDEVASYRARRDWASELAAVGHPTLRFDLPAVGDSTGAPAEDRLVERWVEAVGAAATWLDEVTGGGGVAVFGLGLGGLLALAALERSASIAALLLWGTPAGGRRFVREQRAFSRLEPWNADEHFDPGGREGWLEAGGFGLSPGTLAELAELRTGVAAATALRRVLALDRDGVPQADEILDGLGAAAVELRRGAGPGWGEMSSHPEFARVPRAVAAEAAAWLAGDPVAAAAEPSSGLAEEPRPIVIAAGATGVREQAWSIEQPWGRAFGVLAEPEDGRLGERAAIFVNAGAVRHTGPNRMWVELARRSAAAGLPSLRVDLEGSGEADGEGAGVLQGGAFNQPRFESQLRGVLDAYAERTGIERFSLVALCSGGHNSFRAALVDDRIVELVLVNASGLRWDDRLPQRREAHKAARALDRRWLRRLLHGQVGLRRLENLFAAMLGRLASLPGEAVRSLRHRPSFERQVEADLDRIIARGVRVVLAFTGEEPLDRELRAMGAEARIAAQPGFSYLSLPGSDHTLRPPVAQRAARDLIFAALTGPEAAAQDRGSVELESR